MTPIRGAEIRMSSSYIISGCRTPVGKFLGSLAHVPAPELAAVAIREALRRAELSPDRVDEVIMGNVLSAGLGQAPARQAALLAGCSPRVAALTINKVCGSGLKAVMLADQAIRLGEADCVVAGGMESMSRAPHLLQGARQGWKLGEQPLIDSLLHDGLRCATEQVPMGSLADATAQQHQASRDEQDAFAATSHQRACAAVASGAFRDEIVPVTVSSSQTPMLIDTDEGPRTDTSAATLAKLRPVFSPHGTVTAGNASQLSDGAAAVLVTDRATAERSPTAWKARIVASAVSGVEPKDLFIAPVNAVRDVLRKADLSLADIDLVELNEAFAAQCLACMRPLNLSSDRVNVHGGAIALGHPIGASGARVLVTLLYALARHQKRLGLAALCLGGGNAVAMIVERLPHTDQEA